MHLQVPAAVMGVANSGKSISEERELDLQWEGTGDLEDGPMGVEMGDNGAEGETQGMGSPEWGDLPGPSPDQTGLPALSQEVKSTVSSRPCWFCLTTPRSSQLLHKPGLHPQR